MDRKETFSAEGLNQDRQTRRIKWSVLLHGVEQICAVYIVHFVSACKSYLQQQTLLSSNEIHLTCPTEGPTS